MEKSKRTVSPKLRFPEFHDGPGWEISALGKNFANRQERGVSELPLLSVTDERGVVPQGETNRKDNSNRDKSKHLRVVSGDIVYNTMRMWEGRSAYVDREGLVSPAYTVCQPKNGIHGKFFAYYFKTSSLVEQFRKYSQGLVKDTLNLKYDGFACISVPSPLFSEQQKIADCLGSLDELIAAEGRKLEALRNHKRGLMQQLFPQPGETQPRLRFPEFQGKGEWEEKAISDLGEIVTGSTPTTARLEYYGGDRQFVSPADISEMRFIRETKTTLTELGFQKARPIKEKSVLFVCIGSTIGKVAQNLMVCATNQQINSVTASSETSSDFLYYLLSECSERISEVAGNQAVPIINKSLFSSFKVLCPKKDEQQRIADCFSVLDAQITAQVAKVDSLKQHKHGLMQQLFPAPEEA